jgi:O-antigen/teichoic acid export membrane protein
LGYKNSTIWNIAGNIVPAVISFVVLPKYIELLGIDQYGYLTIGLMIVSFSGFLEFGLGRASNYQLSMNSEKTFANRIIWTSVITNIIFSTTFFLAIYTLCQLNYIKKIIGIDSGVLILNEYLILIGLSLIVGNTSMVLVGILESKGLFPRINKVNILGNICLLIFPILISIYYSVDLNMILEINLIFRSIMLICFIYYIADVFKLNLKPIFSYTILKDLIKYGKWLTISNIFSPIMVYGDKFLISYINGAAGFAYYNISYQLGDKSSIITNSISTVIFPKMVKNSYKKEGYLEYVKAFNFCTFIMTIVTIFASTVMKTFLGKWLSEEISNNILTITQVILYGFWFNGVARVCAANLQAKNLPSLLAKNHCFQILPYFLLMSIFVYYYGLIGASIICSIRLIVDSVIVIYFSDKKIILDGFFVLPLILVTIIVFCQILMSILHIDLQFTIYLSLLFVLLLIYKYIRISKYE